MSKAKRQCLSPREDSNHDIICQIEKKLPNAERDTLLKILSMFKDKKDAMECHFDKLPDEMVMKIINITINNLPTSEQELILKHDYVTDTIAKISTRFQRLAADKSVWKGGVCMTGSPEKVKNLVNVYLTEGITDLGIHSGKEETYITADDIHAMSKKCPNMEVVSLCKIMAWPALKIPWWSLYIEW